MVSTYVNTVVNCDNLEIPGKIRDATGVRYGPFIRITYDLRVSYSTSIFCFNGHWLEQYSLSGIMNSQGFVAWSDSLLSLELDSLHGWSSGTLLLEGALSMQASSYTEAPFQVESDRFELLGRNCDIALSH